MWGILFSLDKTIFLLINSLPHDWILNSSFSLLSGIGSFGIIWLIILSVLFLIEEIEDKKCFLSLVLALILSLFLCDLGAKNIVQRPRPSHVLTNVIEIGDKQRDYSFPSGHTTVSFAAAYVLALHHKKLKVPYFVLASLIAFSRIYLGKHFPSDILGGIVLGLTIGYFSDLLAGRLFKRLKIYSGSKLSGKKRK